MVNPLGGKIQVDDLIYFNLMRLELGNLNFEELPFENDEIRYSSWKDFFQNYSNSSDNGIYKVISELIPDKEKEYYCSSQINSKGFTLLMRMVLSTKEYPELLEIISRLIDLYPMLVDDKNDFGLTPLMLASINSSDLSSFETVELLLQKGSNVNEKDISGGTALFLASIFSASSSSLETVKLLLENGADINEKNNSGDAALILAAISINNSTSSLETVKLLLENGADINEKNNSGDTALIILSLFSGSSSSIEIVKLLIENGADINEKNNYGNTALIMAVGNNSNSSVEIAKLLLENGANINEKNNSGDTALSLAVNNSKFAYDIVEVLIKKNRNSRYNANINMLFNNNEVSLISTIIFGIFFNQNPELFFKILLLFISMGADLFILDAKGRIPLEYTLQLKDFPYKEKVVHTLLISMLEDPFKKSIKHILNIYTFKINVNLLKMLCRYEIQMDIDAIPPENLKIELYGEEGVNDYIKNRFSRSIIKNMKISVNKFIFSPNHLGGQILSGLNSGEELEWEDIDDMTKVLFSLKDPSITLDPDRDGKSFKVILKKYIKQHSK